MMIDIPAQPGEVTPDASMDNQPVLPDENLAGETPRMIAAPQVGPCPPGYACGSVQNGETFSDLLVRYNVSWEAMQNANPTLPTTRLAPGTRYCVPPVGSRRQCPFGTNSYIMGPLENLGTLSELFGMDPGVFLSVNPQLAPSDFTPGRVICVP